jgi:hypothetical protein
MCIDLSDKKWSVFPLAFIGLGLRKRQREADGEIGFEKIIYNQLDTCQLLAVFPIDRCLCNMR